TIKTYSPFGNRHAEVVTFGVLDFLHHPNFRVHLGTVLAVVANLLVPPVLILLRKLGTVIHINTIRFDVGGANELDLLGFAVVQGDRALESVEMILVESLLAYLGLTCTYGAVHGIRFEAVEIVSSRL